MSPNPDPKLGADSRPGLCADCEGLRLDDKGSGGFIGTSDNGGTPRLRFQKESIRNFAPGVLKLLMSQHRSDSSPDFPTLSKSAAAGCGFCGFLRSSILRANIQDLEKQGNVSVHLAYAWGNGGEPDNEPRLQGLVAEVYDAQGGAVSSLHFAIYSSTGQGDATADWLGLDNPPPQLETLCPANISFLKRSIESCVTGCHPPAKTAFAPTRLLDLGTDPTVPPRLVISADLIGTTGSAEPIRYAALSYCWGNAVEAASQTKTEPSNLHERLSAIHEMSAAMQDSIAVCRALSVRYVWIDALCIIQDPTDPRDWERESERVGQVYQHAYFTICAMSTSSCHQSFLSRSQHTFDFDFRSSLYLAAQGKYTLHFTGQYSGIPVFDTLLLDFYNSQWNRRAWVYQEQQLSPRKLLFGQHMLYFACNQKQASENGEVFTESSNVDWDHGTNVTRDQVYYGFRETIRKYSNHNLSDESGRLPALAGVAKQVFELVGSKYLAGLWMEDLHVGLLWVGKGPGMKQSLAERLDSLRASKGSGAPSWSWVSQPGYIEYSLFACLRGLGTDSHLRPEYTSIDGWTTLKGAGFNQFGEVESGTIHVRGKVLPVPGDFVLEGDPKKRLTIREGSSDGAIVAHCCLDWMGTPTDFPGRLEMLFLSSGCNRWEDDETVDQGDDREDDDSVYRRDNEGEDEDTAEHEAEGDATSEASPSPGPATALDDGEICEFCNDEDHNRHVLGLILHPAEKMGDYYRVGVFESRATHTGGAQLFDGLEDVCICIV